MVRTLFVTTGLLALTAACSGEPAAPEVEPAVPAEPAVAAAPAAAPTVAAARPVPEPPPAESLALDDQGRITGSCEICTFVVENKDQHQPYLCRGLKDPNWQKNCVQVEESLMWWLTNEVYWLNYGCQHEEQGAVEWVRPCPAHAVCSWISQPHGGEPYCPVDAAYTKPTAEQVEAARAADGEPTTPVVPSPG